VKDLQNILRRARVLDRAGESYVVATVVRTSGSVYRGPGTRMLVEADLQSLGTISGGCLESDVRENAEHLFADEPPRLLHYDATSEEDILWGTGLGCSGTVDVLLERLPRSAGFHYLDLLHDCALKNHRGVLATVFATKGTTTALPGQHLLLDENGNAQDDISDAQLCETVLDASRQNLATLGDTSMPVAPGLTCQYELEHGGAAVLIEPLLPPITLYIFGAGYDAVPLAHLAGELGWRITVSDHRAPYARAERFPAAERVVLTQAGHLPEDLAFDNRSVAVVMCHNYLQDQAVLAGLVGARLVYLGVLGPHARTQRLLTDLEKGGTLISEEQRARLFTPIGLDIGAETAEEIALSILGEIQAVLTRRAGGKLRDHSGPIHDRPV
jgi:xanthine/CO dehydrogenase XdhC/CoxF family maturation factor